jgi:hypothetical protein
MEKTKPITTERYGHKDLEQIIKIKMSTEYLKASKEQKERIDDFRNSLQVCSFTHEETVNYHKKWLDHIIQKGKELDDMEYDLINKRK